jgi:hypothetical protein
VLLVGVVAIWRGVSALLSPWPDPATFASDARLAACRSVLADVDHVFEMTHARWFPRYFPGWSEGAPELEIDDPALVVLERPQQWMVFNQAPLFGPDTGAGPRPTNPPLYRMCIAVGPPDNALVHLYGPTWFAEIVPVLPGS